MSNPFAELETDTVSILKPSGERINSIKASRQEKKTFISRADINIEVGDLIEQKMSNGSTVTCEVLDPGFHEKFHEIPAGYQIKHKQLGIAEAESKVKNITYNMHGANSRVNNHSTDNSLNVLVNNTQVTEQITKLKSEISSHLTGDELREALELVSAIDAEATKPEPSKPAMKALISALPMIGNIASIGGLLLTMVS